MGRRGRNAKRELLRWTEKLSDTLDIPTAAVPGTAQIELAGNREAIVDGCQGILQYEDNVIRLSTGRLIVRFTGSELMIRTMQENQILISGTILSVDFT